MLPKTPPKYDDFSILSEAAHQATVENPATFSVLSPESALPNYSRRAALLSVPSMENQPLRVAQLLSPDPEPPSLKPLPEPATPKPLPPPDELLPSAPPDTPERSPVPIPDTDERKIVVERFEIEGNTAFSARELAVVTAPFTQRPLSFAELLQVRSAITDLYTDAGYITSGAFIPPQELEDGAIKIRVVEGQLEKIEVKGTRRLNPNYVRRRIAVAARAPLNVNRLIDGLQLLRQNPLIENLSTELSASPHPGRSVLTVQVKEAKSFNIQAVLDNGRSPSVGSFRRRVQASDSNLSGQGDLVSIVYTNTDGSNALDLSYMRSLNARNGTLRFAFGVTSSEVIEPPFEVLEIESDSRFYEISFRQPIVQTPTEELALGLTVSRQESETELLGIPFPLSAGADLEGRTRISALRFFQEWTQRSERQVLAMRSQFSLGLDAFGSTINETLPEDPSIAPDSRFFSWRGQAQWVRLLAPDTLLVVRGDMQLADTALVPLEQFGLGGLERLRGYRQDFLLSDNGAFGSIELRIPIVRDPSWQGLIQVVPFIDVGTAWNRGDNDPDPSTLASAGIGLRMQLGNRFNARLDWGLPLVSVESRDRTWQENGILFSLMYQIF